MAAVGFLELLFFVVLGTGPGDLVSLIHADDYFQLRKIDLTVEKMIQLAGTDPSDGKVQIQQLLALRVLGDDVDEVKKSPKHQAVLQLVRQIAEGNKAQDAHGFAKEYATRTLALLEGRTPPATSFSKDSVRKDAFAWFPASATLLAAADLRGGPVVDELAALRKMLVGKAPVPIREEAYNVAESLGNLRVERTSFAFVDEPKTEHQARIFIRFTGKGHIQRLSELLEKRGGWSSVKRDGITVLQQENDSPALAFIGANDIVIAGYARREKLDSLKVVDEVLALRNKGENAAPSGKFKDTLENLPADINGVVVGQIPEELRQELRAGLGTLPKSIVATLKRGPAFRITGIGAMESEDDARTLSGEIMKLRQKAVDALKDVQPGEIGAQAKVLDNLRKTVESIAARTDGKSVRGSIELAGSLADLMPLLMLERRAVKTAPPVPPKDQ